MTGFLKSPFGAIFTAVLITGVPAATFAQSDEVIRSQSALPDQGMDTEALDKNIEARIKSLHSQLKIAPEQENNWNAVAQVMRHNQKAIHDLLQERRANTTMTAIQNLESYQRVSTEHAAGIQRLIPVFTALYNSMSDQQKKTADAVFMKRQAQQRSGKAQKK